MTDLTHLHDFLPCETPDEWVEEALLNQAIMLLDHADCEKKAASTALSLMFRYPYHNDLVAKLSRVAREELRHFEQVQKFIQRRNIPFSMLTPSRYAKGLFVTVRAHEPAKLIDTLIMAAFIEARSCERFAKLAPHLDPELQKFYVGLLNSEARHFEMYLNFAKQFAKEDISDRIAVFAQKEKELIQAPDKQFRFHSGVPVATCLV